MAPRFTESAAARRSRVVELASELIRLPSPSGDEEAIAHAVERALRDAGCDAVFVDEVGNVVGVLKGAGEGDGVLLYSHLDTGAAGDPELWEHPPLAAAESGDWLMGLGASDCKGALASQIEAMRLLKESGEPLQGDVIVAAVVMAEHGAAFGVSHLLERTLPARGLSPRLAVLGDPTGADVFLGQRGRLELEVTTFGRTAHASAPGLGVNAAYQMMPVVAGLQELASTLPSHPFLDRSTLAVTQLSCTPGRFSLIPDRCVAAVDRRYLPGESLEAVLMQVRSIVSRAAEQDPNFQGEARVRTAPETAYTGITREVAKVLAPFLTSDDHPLVARAVKALESEAQTPRLDKWCFSTEGGAVAAHGLTTLGYGPGEESYSHTPYDRVSIARLVACTAGYAAIARAVALAERN